MTCEKAHHFVIDNKGEGVCKRPGCGFRKKFNTSFYGSITADSQRLARNNEGEYSEPNPYKRSEKMKKGSRSPNTPWGARVHR